MGVDGKGSMGRPVPRWLRRILVALAAALALIAALHQVAQRLGKMQSPIMHPIDRVERNDHGSLRRVGQSSALHRQNIWEVHLKGSPTEIGWAHTQLLRDRMLKNESVLQDALHKYVPSRILRSLVLDLAALNYRDLDEGLSTSRKTEMAASALAFQPDPFSSLFPTYQRFVYLNTLYDISLSFEHSPLVGCTTFIVSQEHSGTGGPLLARSFDFEVDEIFDADKAVFFVEEDGKIPFVSVAWPGLVGVVTGMNENGLALVVHGARAGPVVHQGTPVLHAMRRVLSEASNTDEALALLRISPPLVSHMVVLQDADGHAVVVERSVGQPDFVRALDGLGAVTNHFEGPLSQDEKNQGVRRTTSTLARRQRADVLIGAQVGPVSKEQAVQWLRDRRDVQGQSLPLGDRRAIDALIATHAVVFDTKARSLWVSRGPRMIGAFVEYRLKEELHHALPPGKIRPEIPQDPERESLLKHLAQVKLSADAPPTP